MMATEPADWRIFHGDKRAPHLGLLTLPDAPTWRTAARTKLKAPSRPSADFLNAEKRRAAPFVVTEPMRIAVNAALYLRRPLLITGKPGTGKSSLISSVAYELMLGPAIRWSITSRSTVRAGVYEYDAVGRLQASKGAAPPVQDFLSLGPLGTALSSTAWPRPLLIDEIDKSDLDFANDLLNIIEDGEYTIPELYRLKRASIDVRDSFGNLVPLSKGLLQSGQFPFVVMTSNGEREFPPPFLRRCVRLTIEAPNAKELQAIVESHLKNLGTNQLAEVEKLANEFVQNVKDNRQELATDQLLNAVFLTVGLKDDKRTYSETDIKTLRAILLANLTE